MVRPKTTTNNMAVNTLVNRKQKSLVRTTVVAGVPTKVNLRARTSNKLTWLSSRKNAETTTVGIKVNNKITAATKSNNNKRVATSTPQAAINVISTTTPLTKDSNKTVVVNSTLQHATKATNSPRVTAVDTSSSNSSHSHLPIPSGRESCLATTRPPKQESAQSNFISLQVAAPTSLYPDSGSPAS